MCHREKKLGKSVREITCIDALHSSIFLFEVICGRITRSLHGTLFVLVCRTHTYVHNSTCYEPAISFALISLLMPPIHIWCFFSRGGELIFPFLPLASASHVSTQRNCFRHRPSPCSPLIGHRSRCWTDQWQEHWLFFCNLAS